MLRVAVAGCDFVLLAAVFKYCVHADSWWPWLSMIRISSPAAYGNQRRIATGRLCSKHAGAAGWVGDFACAGPRTSSFRSCGMKVINMLMVARTLNDHVVIGTLGDRGRVQVGAPFAHNPNPGRKSGRHLRSHKDTNAPSEYAPISRAAHLAAHRDGKAHIESGRGNDRRHE